MLRSMFLSIGLVALLAVASQATADAALVDLVDVKNVNDRHSRQRVAAPPRSSLRTVATSCPSGPDFRYESRNSTCTINFRCVPGRSPFVIPGCGCGCRTIAVNSTKSAAPTKVPATKAPVKPPMKGNTTKVMCPNNPDTVYNTRNSNCIINFRCGPGFAPFRLAGCGCGCLRVKKPVASPVKGSKAPAKPTLPASPTRAPVNIVPSTCPTTNIVYKTRNSACVINFLCIKGYEPIKVPGCGCGCHKVTTTNTTTVCPTGAGFSYINRNANCIDNFLCVRGKTSFKIKGCGCGCRTVAPTTPVASPVASTLAPGIKFKKPTSHPK